MSQARLNLFIQHDHAKRLDELAAKKGVSKSSIVAAALASWLSPDAGDQREAATAKRLDRLSRQFERLERDQNILIETLALYVRYYLTVSTPVPEAHQEAAKAQGKARFEQFIEQLGRHVPRAARARGRVGDFPRPRLGLMPLGWQKRPCRRTEHERRPEVATRVAA